jgi:hypothetical protein
VTLILFIVCTLGLVVYAVTTAWALIERARHTPDEQPDAGVLAALVK